MPSCSQPSTRSAIPVRTSLSSLRRSGLILNDPEVIAAMEHSDTPRYIPVTFKKSGADGDALVSAERLGSQISAHLSAQTSPSILPPSNTFHTFVAFR